jgi:ribosomal protein S6
MKLDSLHELIIEFIEKTNRPIFMTGKAGTGKTTFLRYIRSNTKKNLAVVAPTAVAAINAGGVTIHSFFQVPFGPIIPMSNAFSEFSGKSFGPEKAKLIKCLDLLIIDEISMVRADTMDYIDRVLRFIKGNSSPFGGVQLLMIGDLYQLPPVYQKDWHLLGKFYKGPYFFDSLIFSEYPLHTFELTTVHRQSDPIFIKILNEIRNGSISEILLQRLNEHYKKNPVNEDLADHVTLTTHNPLVKKINEERLTQLGGETHRFKAKISGEFPIEAYPTEEELVLKAGAMVMFIKNDSSGKKQFYNGRTAKVESIRGEAINLTFIDDGSSFEAIPEIWENTKYALSDNDQKVTQTSAGSFTQFPLRLAWAITIHKSQGLTFDKAVIDVGAAFAHGQTYVALSRCRTLSGLILKEKVDAKNIITDPSVSAFMKKAQAQIPDLKTLEDSLGALEIGILVENFDFSLINAAWKHLKSVILELLPVNVALSEKIKQTEQLLGAKLSPIGQRFIRQELKTIELKSLEALKVRFAKAAGYFLPNLTELHMHILDLHQHVIGISFHTDYFPTLNVLIEQLTAKIEVFKLLPNIKYAADITKVIRDTAISYKSLDSWEIKQLAKEVKIENPALYAELMDWRQHAAKMKKVLEYHIISDQVVADISAKLPRTLTQLSKIKNVGEGKTAEYGEQILKIIGIHLGENQLFF